jgi:hypothetical protein
VQQGAVGGLGIIGKAVTGGGHPKMLEKFLFGKLRPRLAERVRRRVGGFAVSEVRVGVLRAEARVGRLESQPVEDFVLVVSDVFEKVAGMIGQAAAMAQQIAQSQLARDVGVVHAEAGVMVDDAVVPLDAPLTNKRGQHSGRNRLRDGCDLEHGVRIDRLWFAGFTDAVAFLEQDIIAVDDGDGDARDAGALQRLAGEVVELFDRRLEARQIDACDWRFNRS